MILAARRFWFNDNVIEFLELFLPDEVFHSRDEFIERCKQLELLIMEEQRSPVEILRSRKDRGTVFAINKHTPNDPSPLWETLMVSCSGQVRGFI